MSIPESQLESWSHLGAVSTSRDTGISIRTALSANTSPVAARDVDVYLQGSYRNATNTSASSDVDVVAQCNSTFFYDLDLLSRDEKLTFELNRSGATYGFEDFRNDVATALRNYYGTGLVQIREKCIHVRPDSGRQSADVVPCLLLKRYRWYRGPSVDQHSFIPGIRFITRTNQQRITNFPKQHIDNGERKNSKETGGRYKPAVRLFKNARRFAVDEKLLALETAPSYFVECLLYNVPNQLFSASLQITFTNVTSWVGDQSPDSFISQNGLVPLFGDAPEQWSTEKASRLLDVLKELWDGW